jgi:CBS domain containing-hemolysin-like protein
LIVGITTLEKVVEAILRTSILDEKDIDKIKSHKHLSVSGRHEHDHNEESLWKQPNEWQELMGV